MGGKGSGRKPGFSQYDHEPTMPPEAPNPSRPQPNRAVGSHNDATGTLTGENRPLDRTKRSNGKTKEVIDASKVEEHIQTIRQRSAERAAYWNAELAKEVHQREYDYEWMNTFLDVLRNSGNVRAACIKCGISRVMVYNARHMNQTFADAWDEAKQDAVDILEAVAWQRAQTQSDTLLIFLLKHNRPETYLVPKQVEHSGPGGGAIPLALIDAVISEHDPALQIIEGEAEEIEDQAE